MLKSYFWPALLLVMLMPLDDFTCQDFVTSPTQQTNVATFGGVQMTPLDEAHVLSAQTVIVRDGVIVEVGDSRTVSVPNEAQVVYACGQHPLPGLVDKHAHSKQADSVVASQVSTGWDFNWMQMRWRAFISWLRSSRDAARQ